MTREACPLCGVYPAAPPHSASWESADTPYTDECGCTDRGSCVYHAWSLESRPPRPPEDELLARATKQYERKVARYQEKLAKFAEYSDRAARVAELRTAIDDIRNRWATVPKQLPWADNEGVFFAPEKDGRPDDVPVRIYLGSYTIGTFPEMQAIWDAYRRAADDVATLLKALEG